MAAKWSALVITFCAQEVHVWEHRLPFLISAPPSIADSTAGEMPAKPGRASFRVP